MAEFFDSYSSLFLLGFILLFPTIYSYQRNSAKKKWVDIASKYGWNFINPGDDFHYKFHPFKIEAPCQDKVITVEWEPISNINPLTVAYGTHTKNITKIHTTIDTTEHFNIVKKSYSHDIEKFMDPEGWQDVVIGIQEYDDNFVIKASNPSWLKEHISQDFIEHHIEYPVQIILTDGELVITHPDIEKDGSKIEKSVWLIKDFITT